MTHDLKTWPEYYKDVAAGVKTFELRRSDRNYQVGDTLLLREFAPCKTCSGRGTMPTWADYKMSSYGKCCAAPHGTYTGNSVTAAVAYVLERGPFLTPGYCAMAIKVTEERVL
jgi:hypothetical protein